MLPPHLVSSALRPAGDPLAMLRCAASLERAAQDVGAGGRRARTALDGARFVGPAGDRARAQGDRLGTRSRHTAHELRTLADDVRRRAADLQHAQHAWDRTARREQVPGRSTATIVPA